MFATVSADVLKNRWPIILLVWWILLQLCMETRANLYRNIVSARKNRINGTLQLGRSLTSLTSSSAEIGRAAAWNKKPGKKESKKDSGVEDSIEEFPTYEMILRIARSTAKESDDIWDITLKLNQDQRLDWLHINEQFWPKVLEKIRDAHLNIREMDAKILFKRKPSALMDALFKVTSLTQLQALVGSEGTKSDKDQLKIRYFELSSSAHQMHRFYSKRIRDVLRDEGRIGMIADSIFNYRSYIWNSNATKSGFSINRFQLTPELAAGNLMYMGGKKSVFLGIRELLEATPDVVMKAQYDGKICEHNETTFSIEPAGLDGPYYVLFYLCLTDIKAFLLLNFAFLYKQIYRGEEFTDQERLKKEMMEACQHKIDLFDEAFAPFTKTKSPSYQTYPGIGICDPPPTNGSLRNWKYRDSYIKLTNFIKVFVAREQSLHKGGHCKQTCDVLDATYQPCAQNDTNCILDEEMECLSNPKQCESFNPPCPPRAYQCQNASSVVTVCPSTRDDRLYEYITGKDFHFGVKGEPCENETIRTEGDWKMEQDTLVDTPHFCDVCTCYCFEPMIPLLGDFTVRYINLATVRAKFRENYVVCGIRFEQIDDQIHLRIAEGKALPNNKIDLKTITWYPIEKQKNHTLLARLSRDLRSFNLDDVVTQDPGRVVTGVKIYSDQYNGHVQYYYLGLQVLTHPINEQGIIDSVGRTGKMARNANSTAHRNVYQYGEDPDGPDDPLKAEGPSLPDTTSNQYVVFRANSLDKDAAQITIPFFDSQALMRREPKWLKGIGIYHKSRPGYGGFLSLKLIEHHDE